MGVTVKRRAPYVWAGVKSPYPQLRRSAGAATAQASNAIAIWRLALKSTTSAMGPVG
ncbi:MAG: hypothetical protein NTZ34_07485 [Chloroflexi bacterium]|nr:hypothetical protein [Chloroflexota bacterium]